MTNPDFESAKKAFQETNDRLEVLSEVGKRLDGEEKEKIAELAALSPLQYDRIRKEEANQLSVSVTTLDKTVKTYQDKNAGNKNGLNLKEVLPSENPVNGQELLADMAATFLRYVVISEHQALAVALWVLRAHGHDLFEFNPRLSILSPEKRCGKSTLLEVLTHIVQRPLLTSNVSPAAVFRMIEISHPTLLIDELDSFKDADESLRGILNSGHRRATASAIRCNGDTHEPKQFSTWCPMALATIGRLPGTLEDRSLVIHIKRRKPTEQVETFRHSGKKAEAIRATLESLARSAARWVIDHQNQLRETEPFIPQELTDRAADNWFPLLVIAETIGGDRPEQARKAALELARVAEPYEGVGVHLLEDIQAISRSWMDKSLPSKDLCERLADLEERPWGNWKNGKPLTQAQLARLLQPFGIKSRNVRTQESQVVRGYPLEDFEDAFARYLFPASSKEDNSKCYNATTQASIDQTAHSGSATLNLSSTSQ